jgi:hypothetical protein
MPGARKAGRDLGVNVAELGAQSESETNGQIDMFERAVASNPAAIVLAPAQASALGRPIMRLPRESRSSVSAPPPIPRSSHRSVMATDNVNASRIAANALAAAITKTYDDTEGNIVIISSMPGVDPYAHVHERPDAMPAAHVCVGSGMSSWKKRPNGTSLPFDAVHQRLHVQIVVIPAGWLRSQQLSDQRSVTSRSTVDLIPGRRNGDAFRRGLTSQGSGGRLRGGLDVNLCIVKESHGIILSWLSRE